jgi:hypothetical protein
VDASSLPLSIVIVGVGNDDFSGMVELDRCVRAREAASNAHAPCASLQ